MTNKKEVSLSYEDLKTGRCFFYLTISWKDKRFLLQWNDITNPTSDKQFPKM